MAHVPDYVTGNFYLSRSQMEYNAWAFYRKMSGWTINAICGMLGNMQSESGINPGIWQSLRENWWSGGFGLVQWTPASNYWEWAEQWCQEQDDWAIDHDLDPPRYAPGDMEPQVARINYELETGIQYYQTSTYPISFQKFKESTASPYYLAMAFLYNYERPYDKNQPQRGRQANEWYTYLTGSEPPPDPGPGPSPGGDPFIRKDELPPALLLRRRYVP